MHPARIVLLNRTSDKFTHDEAIAPDDAKLPREKVGGTK